MTELEKLNAERQPKEVQWHLVLNEALQAAADACQAHIDANPNDWYPCGFAWVNIRPARGKFVELLKQRGEGYTDTYYGGYTVYNPSKHHTQWMDAKEKGARAFLDVIKKYGIKGSVGTRMD